MVRLAEEEHLSELMPGYWTAMRDCMRHGTTYDLQHGGIRRFFSCIEEGPGHFVAYWTSWSPEDGRAQRTCRGTSTSPEGAAAALARQLLREISRDSGEL